ncbi:MAG: hypothetical protein AAB483_01675 [Patescibacteria group bacterium]
MAPDTHHLLSRILEIARYEGDHAEFVRKFTRACEVKAPAELTKKFLEQITPHFSPEQHRELDEFIASLPHEIPDPNA